MSLETWVAPVESLIHSVGWAIHLVLDILSFVIAGVAQLVEQLPCKQQVNGSSPFASSLKTLFYIGFLYILQCRSTTA